MRLVVRGLAILFAEYLSAVLTPNCNPLWPQSAMIGTSTDNGSFLRPHDDATCISRRLHRRLSCSGEHCSDLAELAGLGRII
jgi:hypothetical protein